ncbi:MAG TPA: DUF3696 domain-containing protein [Burkholderiales bacterium]
MAHQNNYEICWKNFRGFRDTGWIELRPLTVLLGANNSGKSSFTAPLLLMKQTLQSHDIISALVTRGPLIDAGNYKDLVFEHDPRHELFFGLRFHVRDKDRKLKPVSEYPPGAIGLTFERPEQHSQAPRLKRYELFDIFMRPYVRFNRSSPGSFRLSGFFTKGMTKPEVNEIRKARPLNFLFSSTNIMSNYMAELRKKRPDAAKTISPFSGRFSEFLTVISYTLSEVRSVLLNRLSYIGPLRERPKRYYEVLGELPESIGSRGENAPHLLRSRKDIRTEVNKRIRRFELGKNFKLEEHFKDVFSVIICGGIRKVDCNLADIGFGASQVFPLIVQAVTSERSSLTIAEQPEIHLNPRLQCVLADLFVSMAKNRRHVIIETHSEHLVLRLRRLIAEGQIDTKDVGIYFVEKRDNESIIRNIAVDSLGHIEKQDWPKGFFADSLHESFGLAEAQLHAKAKSGKSFRIRPRVSSAYAARGNLTRNWSNSP